jgi:hypothetical protein
MLSMFGPPALVLATMRILLLPLRSVALKDAVFQRVQEPVDANERLPTFVPLTMTSLGRLPALALA